MPLYTGQRYDPETGFYYYKARYYHPQLGRFLQRDPLGYIDSYNLYAYVNNNPLNFVDPMGHFKIFPLAIHQKMTIEAINKVGGDARYFQGSFVAGVQANDIPDGRAMTAYNYYLRKQGTLTYETHFGSTQFLHFMRNGNETAQQVLENAIGQSKEWYTTSMELKRSADKYHGPNGNIFGNIYAYNRTSRSTFYVGKIIHIIQDSHSGGHARRDPDDGSIIEIFDYGNQDHAAHSELDKKYSAEAVEATAKFIELWNNDADWSEVERFLRSVWKLKSVFGKKTK